MWLTDYYNRKKITITGTTAGAQTNYPLTMTIHKTTGTDSATDVYLGTKVLDNFYDIRLTKSDGTTLIPYWRESVTSGVSEVVWICFDSIPTGSGTATFYIYYNYASATDASDGASTFIFFHYFSGTYPGTKWTGDTAQGSVSGGILTYGYTLGAVKQIVSNPVSGQKTFAARASAKIIKAMDYNTYGISGGGASQAYRAALYDNLNAAALLVQNGGAAYVPASNWTSGIYKIVDILVVDGTSASFFENGVELTGSPVTTNVPSSTVMGFSFYAFAKAGAELCDWCLLRNYASPEPTWTSWGAEEVRGLFRVRKTQCLRRSKFCSRLRLGP